MELGEFLRLSCHRKRHAGEWDCAAFPAAWLLERGYADPMAAYRGAYATDSEGERLVENEGGLLPIFEREFAAVGVPPAEGEPQAGDVAVVSVLGQEAGAVFAGKRWAFVAPRGMVFASLDADCVLRVWRP